MDYLSRICESFKELHGDRIGGDCGAIVGGIATIGGRSVVVIGQQEGHSIAELVARNYGMPRPSGYRKAVRLMRLAGKLRCPPGRLPRHRHRRTHHRAGADVCGGLGNY